MYCLQSLAFQAEATRDICTAYNISGIADIEASSVFRWCQDAAAAAETEQAKDSDQDSGHECSNPPLDLAAQFSAG